MTPDVQPSALQAGPHLGSDPQAGFLRHALVPTNGIRLHCVSAGRGPLLLLLHGFPETWRCWRRQIPALAREFRVVAPDLRGCGDSDKPQGGYDPETLADDIVGLLDALGAPRARVVGHDWGGVACWALAYRHPQRLERLSIINAPHPRIYLRHLLSRQLLRAWYVAFFGLPIVAEWYLERRGGRGILSVFRAGAACPGRLDAEYLAEACAQMLKPTTVRAGLAYYRTALRRGPRGSAFMRGRTDVPIQLVWGEADAALGSELLDGTERHVARLRIDRLPGVGHWVSHEAPRALTRLLVEWHRAQEPWSPFPSVPASQ